MSATVHVNGPGQVFHCEYPHCTEARGLKLVALVIRKGVRRYAWHCEAHR